MKCPKFHEIFGKKISPEEEKEWQEHLQTCPFCQEEKAWDDLLRKSLSPTFAGPSFTAEILSYIHEQEKELWDKNLYKKLTLTSALTALMAALLLFLFHPFFSMNVSFSLPEWVPFVKTLPDLPGALDGLSRGILNSAPSWSVWFPGDLEVTRVSSLLDSYLILLGFAGAFFLFLAFFWIKQDLYKKTFSGVKIL